MIRVDQFTLNAYCTGAVYLSNSSAFTYGYGRISWSNSDVNIAQGLTAYILNTINSAGEVSYTEIPINNGLPF